MTYTPPAVTIEAGFGTAGALVNLSNRAISMTVRRGRDDYTQPMRAGTATVVLRNLDGELDPDNTGSTYYGRIRTGRRLKIRFGTGFIFNGAQDIFEGTISDIQLNYDISGQATVTIVATDGLAELAQRTIPDGTAVVEESTGDRITSILALPEVGYSGGTDIANGQSVCAAGTASGNVLSYLHQVVTTEQGALFVDKNGDLTFYDRYQLLGDTQLTFTDVQPASYDYEQITRLVTQTELYNELAANRPNESDVVRSNTANQTIYGVRFFDLGEVLFDTDGEVTDMLDYALVRYANTTPRISRITTRLDSKPNVAIGQVLLLDLASSCTVEFTPPNSDPINLQCTVESIEHQYTYGAGWRCTFGFSPRNTTSYFKLDDTLLGKLDANVLAF